MKIAVIDGQGGGIGRVIVEKLRKDLPEDIEIMALGTNALAAAQMIKAGANEGASGESAVIFNTPKVDLIVGTINIIMPNSMLGEFTATMAEAVLRSSAQKIILPLTRSRVKIVGTREEPLPHLVEAAANEIKKILEVGTGV
ncbi:DUF3842 family protein [Phosphitispora sp. TUW77]|uniref:DUF3842 family protein n=1 Tax=Phosphitispora sp. TUW77 TaxID=3152361 RepID=UPI003AB6335B